MILFQMVLGTIFKDKTARQTLCFFQKQLYLLSQSQIAYENLSLQLETPLKKMRFSTKDFFSKYDQILRKLRICSHLLKKSLMENPIFCEVKKERRTISGI